MFRKMYHGGSSRKHDPPPAIRDADEVPPRDAQVWPCECPSEDFMVQAGIKEEFYAYVRNADMESFEADKCRQYLYLTVSFVRRFKFSSSRNSQTVLFDLYDKSYSMGLEDFNTACKHPQWGNVSEPRKSEFRDFLASITVGESRDVTQATIGAFISLLNFIFSLHRKVQNGKDEACHMCVPILAFSGALF